MALADRFPAGPGHKAFRRLAAALAASQIGDWLYNVALLSVVYERTGSPSWVALTTAARVAPIVVLGPLGGVVADRFDRRRVMIVSDAARMAMMAALALVAAASLPVVAGTRIPVVAAQLVAAAATAAGSPYPPAVGATTPRLVAAEHLAAANALRSAIGAAGIVVGPALGAGLMIVASPSVAILVNAGTFAASALLVASIPSSDAFAPARAGASAGVLADLRDGAAALRRSRPVLVLVGADVAASTVYGAQTVLLVLLARRLGGDGYGLLMAAIGAGGLLGAAIGGRVASVRRSSTVLAGALLAVAASMALLAASPSLPAAMVLAAGGGAGAIVVEVLSETSMQRLLDETVLARAYGLALPAALGGIVVGSLVAAPLQALLGLDGALVACGAAVALYAAVVALASAAPAPAPAAEPVPIVS